MVNFNGHDLLATPNDVAANPRDRLARARAAASARAAKREAEREAAELERLELEAKYEGEIGPIDRAFVIVDASDLGEGFIVLRLGEGVLWKTFSTSKMDVVDVETFVLPNVVHPSRETYREIVMRRGFLADRCATSLAKLYGVKRETDAGK